MNFRSEYLVFLSVAFLLSSCAAKNAPRPADPRTEVVPVTVTQVMSTAATYHEVFPGMITALNETELRPQVSGYVTGIYFKDGDRVVKGQRLYSIDQEVYKANYNQAIANLQVLEANLVKTRQDANRYHALLLHDAIAKQQVDYADAALQAAKKEVAAAKANVASVHSNVRFSNIYAPFTGTIGISQVKTGTAVVAGQTILNTVSTNNPLAVDFTVDQSEIYHFEQLQHENTPGKDSVFTIAFGDDVYPESGKIFMIDRAVDPQTGTIKVRLIFPNKHDMLKPGMNATVRVKQSTPANSTMIPFKAVTEMLGEFFVYIVNGNSTVSQRKIHLDRQIGDNVIIESGLQPGEKIVVDGIQNLHEGALIKVGS